MNCHEEDCEQWVWYPRCDEHDTVRRALRDRLRKLEGEVNKLEAENASLLVRCQRLAYYAELRRGSER